MKQIVQSGQFIVKNPQVMYQSYEEVSLTASTGRGDNFYATWGRHQPGRKGVVPEDFLFLNTKLTAICFTSTGPTAEEIKIVEGQGR